MAGEGKRHRLGSILTRQTKLTAIKRLKKRLSNLPRRYSSLRRICWNLSKTCEDRTLKISRTSKQSTNTKLINSETNYSKKDERARMQSGRTSSSREERLNYTSKEPKTIRLQQMSLPRYQATKDARMNTLSVFLKMNVNLVSGIDLEEITVNRR